MTLLALQLLVLPQLATTTLSPSSSPSSPWPSSKVSQCDATKQFYQNMACCGSETSELVCNAAKQVNLDTFLTKLQVLASTRANFLGTAASQFVDSNASPCPSTVLEALFQIYLKRMPTPAEVATASSPYGLIKVAQPMIDEYLARSYPSLGSSIANKTFAMVGGSSGWGFTASILLARYGASVFVCSRSKAVFDGSRTAALGSYDDYDADLAKMDAYIATHHTLAGYPQKYWPMYSGPMGVDPALFSKIHFSECDARDASSMLAFFSSVKTKSSRLDGVFFVAGTYGSGNGLPEGSVVSQVAPVGPQAWVQSPLRTAAQVIVAAPDRSAPMIEESPLVTSTLGESNCIDALVRVYGLAKAQSTPFVLSGSIQSSAIGTNTAAQRPFLVGAEYIAVRKMTMIRYETWLNAGFDVRIVMPANVLTPQNGPVFGLVLFNQTSFTPFVPRMPKASTTTPTSPLVPSLPTYDFVESARVYRKAADAFWNALGAVFVPDVGTAAIAPVIVASEKRGIGVRQVNLGNVDPLLFAPTYLSEQPGGGGAAPMWRKKIGSCALMNVLATEDVEAAMQAEFDVFGPGPLCIQQMGEVC